MGGRGLAAQLYWERISRESKALEPANPLVIATGPLAGFSGLSASRCQICSKSPSISPSTFNYSSIGGSWGAYLKFAGLDALIIQDSATVPTYLFLHDGICEFRDASDLWGKGTVQTRETLKSELGNQVRVLATGPAGENLVPIASLLADNDASASSGFGAVMGSKKLKAIVVGGNHRPKPANHDELRKLAQYLRQLKKQYRQTAPPPPPGMNIKQQACFGCTAGCARSYLQTAGGKSGKYLCTSGAFYENYALNYYGQANEVPFLATRLCDDYGIDASAIEAMLVWLNRCYRAGILADENTGLKLSKLGSYDFIEGLLKTICSQEGFGGILAPGTIKAAKALGSEAERLLGSYIFTDGTAIGGDPRLYITNTLLFATEPRQHFPQLGEVSLTIIQWLDWIKGKKNSRVDNDNLKYIAHQFWGGDTAADFTTYQGKAIAAKRIQDRHYVKESAILCYFSWRLSEIELLRPTIISEILTAATGHRYNEDELALLGERIFNLQRAIHTLERGYGREGDTLPQTWFSRPLKTAWMNSELLVPGSGMQPISRKGAVIDKEQFENMKDDYYLLRGWGKSTGLQTEEKLKELGLEDVTKELKRVNLLHHS